MLQNKSGRSSHRKPSKWTAIDVVILLLAVVVVIDVTVRAVDFLRPDRGDSTQYRVHFTAQVYHTIPTGIGVQDDVYLYKTDTRLGYIRAEDLQCSQLDADNVVLSGFFVVDAGSMTDEGSLVFPKSDIQLSPEDDVDVCTDRVVLHIHIVSIEEYVVETDTETDVEEPEENATTEPDPDVIPDEGGDEILEEESSVETVEDSGPEETFEVEETTSETEQQTA